jgi:hypothetical protein
VKSKALVGEKMKPRFQLFEVSGFRSGLKPPVPAMLRAQSCVVAPPGFGVAPSASQRFGSETPDRKYWAPPAVVWPSDGARKPSA